MGGWDWTGPVPEGYYLVRQGDTLSELAERRGVRLETLARWNRLKPPFTIYVGRLLRVEPPDGSPVPRPAPAPSRTASDPDTAAPRVDAGAGSGASPPPSNAAGAQAAQPPAREDRGVSPRSDSGVIWEWPLGGPLAQGFRSGDRTRQGIRIRGRAGDQVKAAADGQVVYAGGGLKGYGNLIIVKHNDNYLSAYGFNRRLFVNEGDRVRRGQAVAEVGQAAGGGPLLHFEIRRDGTAVDPLLYLPPRQ
jgi:lipoprotein NlpD